VGAAALAVAGAAANMQPAARPKSNSRRDIPALLLVVFSDANADRRRGRRAQTGPKPEANTRV
jgi:hypothetical protein